MIVSHTESIASGYANLFAKETGVKPLWIRLPHFPLDSVGYPLLCQTVLGLQNGLYGKHVSGWHILTDT